MSLAEANLAAFRAAFAAEIAARSDQESLAGVIHSDGALSASELSLDTARVLRGGGPWGQGFPEPIFDGAFQIIDARVVGGKHLKMQLKASDAAPAAGAAPGGDSRAPHHSLEAIAFGYIGGATQDPLLRDGAMVELAYRLEVNQYGGAERMQLNCQHLKLA
jgi:single-stranded-DNA-specific exonuclease